MTNRSRKTDITLDAAHFDHSLVPLLLSLWLLLSPLTVLVASGKARVTMVPIITATKVASFTDIGGDGKADPGQTITYTITINNSGPDPATNLTLTDTVDPNTTIVPGSVVATPIAVDETYSVLGNIRIQPNAAAGLLANDNNPNTGDTTGLTASGPAISANNGNVTVNADGSFSYDPPPGFTGIDSFSYIVTSANGSDTATVTLNVAGLIWFIDDNAAAGGDGRLTSPFNCIVGTGCFDPVAADNPGNNIFVYAGTYTDTAALTLLNNQKVIGQGTNAGTTLDATAGVTLPPHSDALPVLNGDPSTVTVNSAASGIVVTTGNSNTLRGFTLGNNGSGAKISSAAFGTLNVSEVALNGAGAALNLDSGTLAATFTSIVSTSAAGRGILLDQVAGTLTSTGGTSINDPATQGILVTASTANLNFGNTTVSDATDAISLQNNPAGMRTFGTITTTGGTGVGFLHSNGGGAVNVTGTTSITNPGGNGIDIDGSNANLSFATTTVNKNSTGGTGVDLTSNATRTIGFTSLTVTTSNGVSLNTNNSGTVNTGGGSLTATGTGGAASLTNTALGLTFISVSSNGGANGLVFSGGSGTFTSGTTNLQNNAGVGLLVSSSAVAANFGNTTVNSSAGAGVTLTSNPGAITFADLDLTPDSGQRAFHALNNTGAINASSGTISTTNATAVEITGQNASARTPLNFRLTTVGVAGGGVAPNGIRLVNTSATGSPGGFRVLGNGGACTDSIPTCTGGQIANTTGGDGATGGAGVRLDNADTVVLTRMRINDHPNYGIRGVNVNSFTLDTSVINGTNGTNPAAPFVEGSVVFDGTGTSPAQGLVGPSLITDSDIRGGRRDNFRIDNSAGTLNLGVEGTTFRDTVNAADASDNVFIELDTSASAFVSVNSSTFGPTSGDHLNFALVNNAVGHLIFAGNTLTGGAGVNRLNQGILVVGTNWNGTCRYDISNNMMSGTRQGHAIHTSKGTGTGDMQGSIYNNTIGINGVAESGASESSGITVASRGAGGLHTALVFGNTIRQYDEFGINLEVGEDGGAANNNNAVATSGPAAALNVTVTGNLAEQPGPNATHGIHLNSGLLPGDNNLTCADIGGAGGLANNVTNGANQPNGGSDIRPRQRQATRVNLPGYGGGPFGNAAVNTYMTGRNTLTTVSTASNNAGGTTNDGFFNTPGVVACAQPSAPTPPSAPVEFNDNLKPVGAPARGEVVAAQSSPDNVTSRPFVSPVPLVKTQAARPLVQQQRAVATAKAAPLQTSGHESDVPTINPPVIMGDSITWNIGTLPAGGSLTITFDVVVDNPFTGAPPQVSNQGTVSADGGISILTNDPSTVGANNPTVTPINVLDIFARDGKAPEPTTGTAPLLFTIALSSPATSSVMVNYTTTDDTATGGASCGGSVDYVTTSGTVTFAAGEQVRTVSVDICSDGPTEPDETLLLNLTGTNTGTILDNQAVGTITAANPEGAVLISELRTFGPGGGNDADDDFVEVYNNTDSQVTVAASDASAGWGVYTMTSGCDSAPLLLGTIPNGTSIPPRGHFLLVGSTYSLANYGGTGAAPGDLTMSADLPGNASVAVFTTSDVTNLSTVTRLDAVGFGANTGGAICDLLREETTAPAATSNLTSLGQHSYVRDSCGKGGSTTSLGGCPTGGALKDSNVNAADFYFVDTNGIDAGAGQRIGAPGPENLTSPLRRDAVITVSLLDATVAATSPPNRVRDLTSDPANNSTFGTLSIRRRFVNNSGTNVTRLRFRVADISTFPVPSGVADLRARTSSAFTATVNDAATCASTGTPTTAPCTVTVEGTTLEAPPNQPNGGGFNSSMAAGTITLGTPLAAGDSINLQFLLGVQQTGSFKFIFIIEALP
jgi:uncharacterized repeat protein (TIGR01451 family)